MVLKLGHFEQYTRNTWGWQPYAETCRGKILNVLIKIPYFLRHLLVFSQTIQAARFNHQDGQTCDCLKPAGTVASLLALGCTNCRCRNLTVLLLVASVSLAHFLIKFLFNLAVITALLISTFPNRKDYAMNRRETQPPGRVNEEIQNYKFNLHWRLFYMHEVASKRN
jgi:hypothetical protein